MAQGLNNNEIGIADLRYRSYCDYDQYGFAESETDADFTLLGYRENKVRSLFVSQCE